MNFLLCFVTITIFNLLCVGFGFLLSYLIVQPETKLDEAFSYKLKKMIDEEAYVPEED